jgi:hypothetical protein
MQYPNPGHTMNLDPHPQVAQLMQFKQGVTPKSLLESAGPCFVYDQ